MKKILFVLCMIISVAYGQSYSPALHTVTNKALGIAQANPTDARSYYYDPSLFLYRPYQSTSEVLAYLNLSKYRTGQFSIIVNNGGTLNPDGTFSGGTFDEYWFKDGVANGDLVIKAAVVTTDTASWNTAYRKRPVSLAYDSTTNIISLTLGDGSILYDTLSALNPVSLYNGSSTVGDTLLVSSISGDTAWVKNIFAGRGLVGVKMGDSVLKINVDTALLGSSTMPFTGNLYFGGRKAGGGSGSSNVVLGNTAVFQSNTTGSDNIAIGASALAANTTGIQNAALGSFSLTETTTGGGNTANGYNSLRYMSRGRNNTAMGYRSGGFITGGSTTIDSVEYSVFIGADTRALRDSGTNEIVIGYNTTGRGSNTVSIGNTEI